MASRRSDNPPVPQRLGTGCPRVLLFRVPAYAYHQVHRAHYRLYLRQDLILSLNPSVRWVRWRPIGRSPGR